MIEQSDEALEQEIAQASERAKASKKDLLLVFSADWCPDCREVLHVMNSPEFAKKADDEFEVVVIEVGRFDRHKRWIDRFGVKKIATLVRLSPNDLEKPLLQTTLEPISNKITLDPASLMKLLTP